MTYALLCGFRARHGKALSQAMKALELDPLRPDDEFSRGPKLAGHPNATCQPT